MEVKLDTGIFKNSTKEMVQMGQIDKHVDTVLCFDEVGGLRDIVLFYLSCGE